MELTITELRQRRTVLIRRRADGVTSVKDQNGEEIVYKTDSQMAAAIAALDSEIRRLEGRNPTTIVFATSKGL